MVLNVLYGIVTIIAMLLIVGYCKLINNKNRWFILLFVSVFVVNLGYLSLSLSNSLETALLSNRLAYFGSVFLPLCMLMIITDVCKMKCAKWQSYLLIMCSAVVFVIAASGGYTDWYYSDVTVTFIDGAAKLVKEYGPLHKTYYIYLFSYFLMMIGVILYATLKKKAFNWKHSVLLLCVTFGNILIWFIEQLIKVDYEFLSVSYVVTELFLLFLYGLLQDHGILDDIENAAKTVHLIHVDQIDIDKLMEYHPEIKELTNRELEVLKPLLEDKKRKDIADELSVTEHTIKKHTAHIFTKMEVTNRKELREKLRIKN